MKKVLLALILVASAFVLIGNNAFAAGEGTGDLVIHFKAWDENYDNLGSWAWGGPAAGKLKDGVDDFGAYWTYADIPVGTSVGFIAVVWPTEAGPDWNQKLTGDVNIAAAEVVENATTHIYVFQGAATSEGNPGYLSSDPTARSLIVVYYDSTGNYEENLGVHHWGWTAAGPEWNTPAQLFSNVGQSEAGIPVKGLVLRAAEDWAGLLVYYGDGDASKKTGDVTLAGAEVTAAGETGIAYVVNKGDANTSNNNVFYNDYAMFAEEAFSFKLMPFNADDMSGTYAVNPTTIIVKTSANITNPYPTMEDKDAAVAIVENWFMVKEITGEDTYGDALAIERVDFARNNSTLNAFVVILADELDNTKEYEVFFSTNAMLEVEKTVEVTLNVTVPANTPTEAVISAAGAFQGWTPGDVNYTATKVGETLEYTLTFDVTVSQAFTAFEYKWTRGSWNDDEFIAENRKIIVPFYADTLEFNDVVESWKDIEAPENQYAAPDRGVLPTLYEASVEVAMDTEAPVITFIAPTAIVGVEASQRIIEVAWGQPFNMTSFPRFRANDNRDGDITAFIYIPKGANSVLDTRTAGDYTIMLRVVDVWGNVTEETFIFRVVQE